MSMETEEIRKAVADGVKDALGEAMPNRYIDVSRIPLICQNIDGIHTTLKELKNDVNNKYVSKEAFFPVRMLVFGFAGIILITVIAAIIAMVLHAPFSISPA